MRILFISDYIPWPLYSGDRIRVYNLVRCLARRHQVTLVGFHPDSGGLEGVDRLRAFCRRVEALPLERRSKARRIPRVARCVAAGRPFELEYVESAEMTAVVRELAERERFDVVHFEHSRMAQYIDAVPESLRERCVLGFEDVAFHQYRRIAGISGGRARRARTRLYAAMLRRWEPRIAERFARCVTV
jgi:hypothetical protein